MIEIFHVASGEDGLRIYRIDAQPSPAGSPRRPGVRPGRGFDPFGVLFEASATPTTRYVLERFDATGPPAGERPPGGGFRVACHVVSLPDLLLVVDSTFSGTGPEVFPAALEHVVASEGRTLEDRRIVVLYTHGHWDHAGGHQAVEQLGGGVHTVTHRHTRALHAGSSPRNSFFSTRAPFFRDCDIALPIEEIQELVRQSFERSLAEQGLERSDVPGADESTAELRVDRPLALEEGVPFALHPRVEVWRFDGHVPGHLCLCIDGAHLISGDMWLPATTSTITPGTVAERAGVPRETTGVARYIASSERLLDLPVDDCISYPSHETIFRNPKRMALRDLELFSDRFELLYRVLAEHRQRPMRILDLAWGGPQHLPVWKVERSKQRLMAAHDEATAHVQDLLACGDLREVSGGRYLWTGHTALRDRLRASLASARTRFGHLEFRSRGLSPESRVDWR